MGLRMRRVVCALDDGGLELLANLEASGNTAAACECLLGLKGVGRTVVQDYMLLRSSALL